MQNPKQVQDNLKMVLAKATNVQPDDISGQETLDMLGIDSAGTISLAAHIEEQFGVMVDAQDVVGNVTVTQIAQLILQKSQTT